MLSIKNVKTRCKFVQLPMVMIVIGGLLAISPKPAWGQCEANEWLQFTSPSIDIDHQFGKEIAISGDRAVISGPLFGVTRVFAYLFNGVTWTEEVELIALEGQPGTDGFGFSADIDGDMIVVGANEDNLDGNMGGAAYIFQRDQGGPGNWGQIKRLTANDPDPTDWFGGGVAISGDVVVIGAPFDDEASNQAGGAYIYHRDQGGPNNWGFVRKILGTKAFSFFGENASISNDSDVLVVGGLSPLRIFERNQGGTDNWGEIASAPNDSREVVISQDGNTVLSGNHQDGELGDGAGAAFIWARNQGGPNNWGLVKKIFGNDTEAFDGFGKSVALLGDMIIVGAWHAQGALELTGSAYVFGRDQGGPDNWGQLAKLTPSDPTDALTPEGARFGFAVAIGGTMALVGGRQSHEVYAFRGLGDCNQNSVLDVCELVTHVVVSSGQLSPIGSGSPQSFTLISPPESLEDVTLSFSAQGDFSAPPEVVDVDINGVPVGTLFGSGALDCADPPDEAELIVPAAMFNDAIVGGQDAVITMTASAQVNGGQCNGSSYITVAISYRALDPDDLDDDGVLDECLLCPADLDGDGSVGTSDLLELFAQWGTAGSADLDGDGTVGTSDLLELFANWGPCV